MSDFDFDELDKAVSGALGNDAVSRSQANVPKETEAPASTPVPTTPVSEPVKPTVPPAIRRGSGRFMDVVHPSSDMRSSRPARGAFTPPEASPTNELTKPSVAEPNQEEAPLEMTTQDDAFSAVGEWSKPLESPFLPDAKVEKRPLGGSAEGETFASLLEETSKEPLLEAPDEPRLEATTMPDPIDFATQSMNLPFENEDTGEQKPLEEPPVVEENPLGLIEDDMEGKTLPTPLESPQPASNPEPVGPTSITQQYTEQVSAEHSSGAIYDTENYHQPLAHDGKKHSSVWTILGILLLVVLGAGAGVAFYFFVLPNF